MESAHIFCTHFIHMCVSRTDAVTNSHLRRSEEEELSEVTSLEITGNDITGSHITGNDRTCDRKCILRMRNWFLRFFLTIVVVQNVPLRMTGSNIATGCDVNKRHVTRRDFLGRVGVPTCATGSCAISDQTSLIGLPLEMNQPDPSFQK